MVGKCPEDGKKIKNLAWVRFGSISLSAENKRLFSVALICQTPFESVGRTFESCRAGQ